MEAKEKKVIEFYLDKRLSIQQITEILQISSYRARKILKANKIPKRSISEAITAHHIIKFGAKEFIPKQKLSFEDKLLKVAGVMLYWGEGNKGGNAVALSNSNPYLIKLFLRFLRIICGVAEDRIRISIHYYTDHDPNKLIEFWSNETGVQKSQFHKPWLHIKKKGTYRNPSKYGTIMVRYADKKLLGLILQWIEEYKELGSIN